MLDGVAGAFVGEDGVAFEDGGGVGAVVAAVAVGDLLAHAVVCGGEMNGLVFGWVFGFGFG